MKMKMTRGQIAKLPVNKIVTAGYCDLQYLLSGVDPIGYNSGKNGWYYDVYVVGGICILTGYLVPSKYPKAAKADEYEQKARALRHSGGFARDTISETEALRKAFCMEQLRD